MCLSGACRFLITGVRVLVADQGKVWIGLEYFCNDTDPIWELSDQQMAELAVAEIVKIGILDPKDVEDTHVVSGS